MLVNLAAFFILDALIGAMPNRNGKMNMTTIPPHFAPIEARDSAARSGSSWWSDVEMLYILANCWKRWFLFFSDKPCYQISYDDVVLFNC